jgi:hypothetical protein
MDKTDFKKLSKIELEELGRTKGVELDRRLTKSKLVSQIVGLFKTSKPEVTKRLTYRERYLQEKSK